jgi:hypothetical protein
LLKPAEPLPRVGPLGVERVRVHWCELFGRITGGPPQLQRRLVSLGPSLLMRR